ncbi:unnamed protein product [Prorocentrum cordatum]|uniref:C2 domain-containing protein n=1 Tax=Prorocentrum cordatum TaxID=2364126 RepID=A0ABN9REG2_9DINO|nr:unnamed protein product [Polarella glacialis]
MAARVYGKRQNVAVTRLDGKGPKTTTCAQRIEEFTTRERKQLTLSEIQVLDVENLFRTQDIDGAGMLCRGSLTETLRTVGLEDRLGEQAFRTTVRLAFDAFSADSHFLSMTEFKQLYYLMSIRFPELLPRQPFLKICILSAKGLPALDMGGKSDPFTSVQVVGKERSKMKTRYIEKTLDPVWSEEFDDRFCYEQGDALEFCVFDWDKGNRSELIGKARLASSEFHKQGGFQGDLKLTDLPSADFRGPVPTLRVRVLVRELEAPPLERSAAGQLVPGQWASSESLPPRRNSGLSRARAVAHFAAAGGGLTEGTAPLLAPDQGVAPVAGRAAVAGGAPE